MPVHGQYLNLERCPYCGVNLPNLQYRKDITTTDSTNANQTRFWVTYECGRCGGVVLAYSYSENEEIIGFYPSLKTVHETVPERAKEYLSQAMATIHAPAGSLMLSASAVDAMLKAKGYSEGALNTRIKQAAENHLITDDMAAWAHDIRLDANEQRHADENAPLPTTQDAKRCVDFAEALSIYLFVLPARVRHGRSQTEQPPAQDNHPGE